MKPTNCLHYLRRISLLLIITAGFAVTSASQADYRLEINHLNEVTHLEIPNVTTVDYQINKKKDIVEMVVNGLDAKSAQMLAQYSDRFIRKIEVTKNQSLSKDIVKIYLSEADIEMFDYLTDSPSSLSIDFFIDDRDNKFEKEYVFKKEGEGKDSKKVPARGVASAEFIKGIGNVSVMSDLDDLKHKEENKHRQAKDKKQTETELARIARLAREQKYNILSFDPAKIDFPKDHIIESRGNIYIRFPILLNQSEYLSEILNRKISYEFEKSDDVETKDFMKLKKLYSRGEYKFFLKAKKIFFKKHASQKYDEMINYMEADAYFNLSKAENSVAFFDEALRMYDALLAKYPTSPIAERTMLFVAFLRMKSANYIDSVKTLKAYVERYPQSPLRENIELLLAQSLLRIKEYKDAVIIYEKLFASNSNDIREQAYFDVGDVFFDKKDYAKAVKYYNQALKMYPASIKKYPNAYFNLGEAEFIQENYKESMAAFKKFIEVFPVHDYTAFAWTRIGETFEIANAANRTWKGYYNESTFRFANANGGKVAKIHLLYHQGLEVPTDKLSVVINGLKDFQGKITIPNAEEFLIFKISDLYFGRGLYKEATDTLTAFFKNNQMPVYADKFHKRIGRTLSFQIRDLLKKGRPQEAMAVFDQYDALWFNKSQRMDFPLLKGEIYQQAKLYKRAVDEYAKYLAKFDASANPSEVATFEELPEVSSVNLKVASCYLELRQYKDADTYLDRAEEPKLSAEDKDVYHYVSSRIEQERGDLDEAVIAAQKIAKPSLAQTFYLADLQDKAGETTKAIQVLDQSIDGQNREEAERFKILKQKLAYMEKGDAKKFADFLQRFYDEYKTKNYEFDREKYLLGTQLVEKSKIKEADDVFSSIAKDSYWQKLAAEVKESQKWNDQYKKYVDRIPAMAPAQEKK